MSKLQTVKVVSRQNVYGQAEYAIVGNGGKYDGCTYRGYDFTDIKQAYALAEKFDAENLDPALQNWGGLDRA